MSGGDLSLGRRAVACRHWRWMPGMRTDDGTRLPERLPRRMLSILDVLPDLADAATVGCLVSLAREAWGCPHLSVVGTGTPGDWRIDAEGVVGVRDLHSYATEAAAVVAALEAAP